MRTVLVIIAVAIATQVQAQQVTPPDELRRTLIDLRNAADALPSGPVKQRILDAARWFDESVRLQPARHEVNVSPEYTRSLQLATGLLKTRPSEAVLKDIADDLEAKRQHCSELGVGMGGTVVVTVRTPRAGVTVNNWQVQYLLKFYESVSGAQPGTFGRVSSPTVATLEPGRYWIWARDPSSGKTSERVLTRVAGAKQVEVDVPVP
jgi:hypothetical protein